jgi:hypothetical protein
VARQAKGISSDVVEQMAKKEASGQGAVGDVADSWLERLRTSSAARAYRDVPDAVRSTVCADVSATLTDLAMGKQLDAQSQLRHAADAVAGQNQTYGARQLAQEIASASADLEQGRPVSLALLLLSQGTCAVA